MSETRERGIFERLNAVMKAVTGVEKDSVNQQGRYKYAGHEAVTEAVRPAFVREGIVQSVTMPTCELLDGGHVMCTVVVRWSCHDNPASYVEGAIPSLQHCQTSSGKPTAQQIGQALSYAVKNFTFKTLMLTGDTEGDSDASVSPETFEPPPAAVEFMRRLEAAKDEKEVAKIGEELNAWGQVGNTQGLRDKMTKCFRDARARIAQSRLSERGMEP